MKCDDLCVSYLWPLKHVLWEQDETRFFFREKALQKNAVYMVEKAGGHRTFLKLACRDGGLGGPSCWESSMQEAVAVREVLATNLHSYTSDMSYISYIGYST